MKVGKLLEHIHGSNPRLSQKQQNKERNSFAGQNTFNLIENL